MCGGAIPEKKRGDSKFCRTSCKARFWAQKEKIKKDGLAGITLEPKKKKPAPINEYTSPPEKEPLKEELIEKKEVYADKDGPGPFLNVIYEPGAEPETETDKEPDNNEEDDHDPQEQAEEEPLPEQYYTRKVIRESEERRQCREKREQCRASILKHENIIILLDDIIQRNYKKTCQPGDFREVYKRMEQFQPIIDKAKRLKTEGQRMIEQHKEWESELQKELAAYPPPEEIEERVESVYYLFKKAQREGAKRSFVFQEGQDDSDPPGGLPDSLGDNTEEESIKNNEMQKKKNGLETDLIVSGTNLSRQKKPRLNFAGRWQNFFGQPQTNFFCVVHGLSGQGKSVFALQFAKYLAQNFGTVLYVSGEEGFANTFIEKIEFIGLNKISRFYSTEKMKGGEAILKHVPNKYHFIFIDSLNNMHIDPEMMQAIRNRYSQSGFIAICQNTKAGQIRGSYEIVHDSDIEVRVHKGIAVTNKNRFGAVDREFDVLGIYKNKIKNDNDGKNF